MRMGRVTVHEEVTHFSFSPHFCLLSPNEISDEDSILLLAWEYSLVILWLGDLVSHAIFHYRDIELIH